MNADDSSSGSTSSDDDDLFASPPPPPPPPPLHLASPSPGAGSNSSSSLCDGDDDDDIPLEDEADDYDDADSHTPYTGVPIQDGDTGRFLLHGSRLVLEVGRMHADYNMSPIFRCMRSLVGKALTIPPSEAWLYESLPGLVVTPSQHTSDNGCTVVVSAADLTILHRNMRYGTRGNIISVSPRLVRYTLYMWLVGNERRTSGRPPVVPPSLQITTSVRSTKAWGTPVLTYARIVKKCLAPFAIQKCKAVAHAGDSSINYNLHVNGEFVTGAPICRKCFAALFTTALPGWCSLADLKELLPAILYARTFGRLSTRPVRHVLHGMAVSCLVNPRRPLTLAQYAAIGRAVVLDPIRFLTLCPIARGMSSAIVASGFGPAKWALFHHISNSRKRDRVVFLCDMIGRVGTRIRDHLDYFGWAHVQQIVRVKHLVLERIDRIDLYNARNCPIGHSLMYMIDLVRGMMGPSGGIRRAGKPQHMILWGSTIMGLRALAKCHLVVSLVSRGFRRPSKDHPSPSLAGRSTFQYTHRPFDDLDSSTDGDDDNDDRDYATPSPPPRSISPVQTACASGAAAAADCASPDSSDLPFPPGTTIHDVDAVWLTVDDVFTWDATMAATHKVVIPKGASAKELRVAFGNTTFHITDAHRIQWCHFHHLVEKIGATRLVIHGSLFGALEGCTMHKPTLYSDETTAQQFPHPVLGGVFANLFDAVTLGSSSLGGEILFKAKSMRRELITIRHQPLSFDPDHAAVAARERHLFDAKYTAPWLGVLDRGESDDDDDDIDGISPVLHPAWDDYTPLLPLQCTGEHRPQVFAESV
jgi:hypothetical protein